MNKFLSIVAVSSLFASSIALADGIDGAGESAGGEKSGLFVGVHGGVTLFGLSQYDSNGKKLSDKDFKASGLNAMDASFDIGAKIGYQHFFMPLVGVRGYLSYDFEGSRNFMKVPGFGTAKVSFQNIALNVDALINFINNDNFTFGVYAGFGLGYGISSLSSSNKTIQENIKDYEKNVANYSGFNIPLNIGVAATFATHHKVELGAKIQTLAAGYSVKNDKKAGIFINPYVINIGYSYIF